MDSNSQMSAEQIRTLVEQMVSAWNVRDLNRFLSLLSEDVVWSDPAMALDNGPASGKEAVRKFIDKVLIAFPDFEYRVHGELCISTEGNKCAVPFRIVATNLGPFAPPGFAPTRRKVEVDGMDLLEFRDHKVVKILTYFDVISAFEQLYGFHLRLPPRSVRERLAVMLQKLIVKLFL